MSASSDAALPSGSRPAAGTSVSRAAGIMITFILASRILALVRDMVISYYFGASRSMEADAYRSAFSIPDLMYYLIAGGALSSAFIPVFTEYLTKGDEENAWEVFSVFGTAFALGLTVVILLGELFAAQLVAFAFPGFPPDKLALTVQITRIIFPAQLCFFLGGLMMATLQSRNHFLMPAMGPCVYNVFIILGGAIGGALFGPHQGIFGLAWGVLVGAFIGNVVMQIWTMRRVGVRYRPSLNVRHPGVIKAAKLMLPVLLGLSLPQLCSILTRPFASDLGDGPITWLDNGLKVMQLPLGIFAQGLSVAIFPTLSAMAAQGDLPGLRRQFSLGLRYILFLTVPSAVGIIVLATPITAVLFQRGLWTWEDTLATASVTVFYALAIFAVSGQQIVNRGFYAMQNTLTPMVAGTVATLFFLGLNCALVGIPGTGSGQSVDFARQVRDSNALAVSYTVSMIVYLAGLLVLFNRQVQGLDWREIGNSVGRIAVCSAAMGAAVWGVWTLLSRALGLTDPHTMTTMRLLIALAVCTGVGGAVYLASVRLLRVPEAEVVLGSLGSKFGRFFKRG